MSTSLRFRSRQGEKNVESSSVQRLQSALDIWAKSISALFPRYAVHLVVVTLAVLAFMAGPPDIDIQYQLLSFATPTSAPSLGSRLSAQSPSGRGGERERGGAVLAVPAQTEPLQPTATQGALMTTSLLQAPVIHTTIPERLRREVITYVVEPGDYVEKIAIRFGLEPETVMWANGNLASNPDLLRPGQELTILPIDGVYHTVVSGDTLEKIAKKYEANVEHILACPYNDLDPEAPQIVPGQKLIVPGGIKPYVALQVTAYRGPIPKDAKKGTGVFVWPTSGRLTDRFGFATLSGRWHGGLDIAAYTGAPIYAADSGFVTYAGWSKSGYGNLIIIDHQNGFETRYAHLSAYYVSVGQSVGKGAQIAAMGSTGNSTGAHLHFEIRYNGVRKNPQLYLP